MLISTTTRTKSGFLLKSKYLFCILRYVGAYKWIIINNKQNIIVIIFFYF